jgi:hypothetical protein
MPRPPLDFFRRSIIRGGAGGPRGHANARDLGALLANERKGILNRRVGDAQQAREGVI